jgi:Mg2+ and Co2+ transporter CorA
MLDKALNMLNKISKDIIYLEEQIFDKDKLNKDLLESLMIKRRNIAFLKHTFKPQSELLQELQKVILNFYE